MRAELCVQLHSLRREVLSSRTRGRVVIEFADGVAIDDASQARFLADGMLSLVNLPPLGRHWNHTDRPRAAEVIAAVLHQDLETRRTTASVRRAGELANRVLSIFLDNSIYLSNVRPSSDLSQSPHNWASGSDTTELDAGVAIVSAELLGLLWVEDRP